MDLSRALLFASFFLVVLSTTSVGAADSTTDAQEERLGFMMPWMWWMIPHFRHPGHPWVPSSPSPPGSSPVPFHPWHPNPPSQTCVQKFQDWLKAFPLADCTPSSSPPSGSGSQSSASIDYLFPWHPPSQTCVQKVQAWFKEFPKDDCASKPSSPSAPSTPSSSDSVVSIGAEGRSTTIGPQKGLPAMFHQPRPWPVHRHPWPVPSKTCIEKVHAWWSQFPKDACSPTKPPQSGGPPSAPTGGAVRSPPSK